MRTVMPFAEPARPRRRPLGLAASGVALLAAGVLHASVAQANPQHGVSTLENTVESERILSDPGSGGQVTRGFGRLFGTEAQGLRPHPSPPHDLSALGGAMRAPSRAEVVGEMPAGFTFLGQFIDHDITFDTISKLDGRAETSEIDNARTVDLDLDSIYGEGPERDPQLFALPYLRVGELIYRDEASERYDLLRTPSGPNGEGGTALIGDPRNDENFVISQLQAAFIAFHNTIAEELVRQDCLSRGFAYECENAEFDGRNYFDNVLKPSLVGAPTGDAAADLESDLRADGQISSIRHEIFENARHTTIHYYHRLIVEDFLPRLVGIDRTEDLMRNGRDFYFPRGFRGPDGGLLEPYMPVEFSVAAYRYGHAQVRASYTVREDLDQPLFRGRPGEGTVAVRGFAPMRGLDRYSQPYNNVLDWAYFFSLPERGLPQGFNRARVIDPEMAPFLHDLRLPAIVPGNAEGSLATRNLQRGRAFRLPSGQRLAEVILPALERRGLLAGYFVPDERPSGCGGASDGGGAGTVLRPAQGWGDLVLSPDKLTCQTLNVAETPLWYYVLQEAREFGGRSTISQGQVTVASAAGETSDPNDGAYATAFFRLPRGLVDQGVSTSQSTAGQAPPVIPISVTGGGGGGRPAAAGVARPNASAPQPVRPAQTAAAQPTQPVRPAAPQPVQPVQPQVEEAPQSGAGGLNDLIGGGSAPAPRVEAAPAPQPVQPAQPVQPVQPAAQPEQTAAPAPVTPATPPSRPEASEGPGGTPAAAALAQLVSSTGQTEFQPVPGDDVVSPTGHTLGPVGGTIVGEVLIGLIEHYREKTGRGLDYRAPLCASADASRNCPLSAYAVNIGGRSYGERYLLRNLIEDAGVGAPVSGSFVEVGPSQ